MFRTKLANRPTIRIPGMNPSVLPAMTAGGCRKFALTLVANRFVADSCDSRQTCAFATAARTDFWRPKVGRAGAAYSFTVHHQPSARCGLFTAETRSCLSDANVADRIFCFDISSHLLSAFGTGARFEQSRIATGTDRFGTIDFMGLIHRSIARTTVAGRTFLLKETKFSCIHASTLCMGPPDPEAALPAPSGTLPCFRVRRASQQE